MNALIDKAKQLFIKMVEDFGSDPFKILPHVPEVERWALKLLEKYPKADKETVLLGVWFHDLGHYPIPTEIDHAIRSEQRAKDFLEKEKYPAEKMKKVLHCIRAHRCKDVQPETIEAKIVAFSDSASHITSPMYFELIMMHKDTEKLFAKMDRDYKDLELFPEFKKELVSLHDAWKKVILEYMKLKL